MLRQTRSKLMAETAKRTGAAKPTDTTWRKELKRERIVARNQKISSK